MLGFVALRVAFFLPLVIAIITLATPYIHLGGGHARMGRKPVTVGALIAALIALGLWRFLARGLAEKAGFVSRWLILVVMLVTLAVMVPAVMICHANQPLSEAARYGFIFGPMVAVGILTTWDILSDM